MLNLYQPEKYKVYTGKGPLGFCTVWNEPERVFKSSKIFEEKIAILGTLYSKQGVNIILRNLALNPQIRKLILWGNGFLSNTQFGLVGKSLILKLWSDGVDKVIEKEIQRDVLRKIIDNVALIDWSDIGLEEILGNLKAENSQTQNYMKSVSFPDAKLEEIETFPSEEIGWLLRGNKIVEAWLKLLDRILRYGLVKGTQYGYRQRELIGVTWVISNENPEAPDFSIALKWPEELQKIVGVTSESIKEYYSVFLSPKSPEGVSYTYGNRLMAYPRGLNSMDQIEEVIIKQLKNSLDSRRAVATTMIPSVDAESNEPPCITQIQAIQSKGKLHLLVTVRSHDIFKSAIPNAFGLRTLQKTISDKLGFSLGQLQITSQSAHIYEQDWDNAHK